MISLIYRMIIWEALITRWLSHPCFHLHTLHWICVHLNTQAALSVRQPQRSSLPFKFYLWARDQDAETHRPASAGAASPTDQRRWLQTGVPASLFPPITPSPAQKLPWALPGCREAEPVHGIPTKRLARTHCPSATWPSQPYSTRARDLTEARMSQYLPVTERILKTHYRYVRWDTLTLFPSPLWL